MTVTYRRGRLLRSARSRIAFALAGACAALVLAAPHPAPVAACSGDVDDAVRGLDLIVVARASRVDIEALAAGFGVVDLSVTLDVDRYLKGDGPRTLTAFDRRAARFAPHIARNSNEAERVRVEDLTIDDIVFGGDGCSALFFDPRGRTLVLGLVALPDGTFAMHRMAWFGASGVPEMDTVDQGIARVETLLGRPRLAPPNVGHGPRSAGSSPALRALTFLAPLVLAAAVRRATTPPAGSPAR